MKLLNLSLIATLLSFSLFANANQIPEKAFQDAKFRSLETYVFIHENWGVGSEQAPNASCHATLNKTNWISCVVMDGPVESKKTSISVLMDWEVAKSENEDFKLIFKGFEVEEL